MGASNWSGLAIPKPEPRWKGKQAKETAAKAAERDCYAKVDKRDGPHCRICGKRVGGIGLLLARIHHHLVYRSKGVIHEAWNVLSICVKCDDQIHREGTLKVYGNADTVDERGQFCGVTIERLKEHGWEVERVA